MDIIGSFTNNDQFIYSTHNNKTILFKGKTYLVNNEDYAAILDMFDRDEIELIECMLLISNNIIDITDKIYGTLPSFGYLYQNNYRILFKDMKYDD